MKSGVIIIVRGIDSVNGESLYDAVIVKGSTKTESEIDREITALRLYLESGTAKNPVQAEKNLVALEKRKETMNLANPDV